MTPVSSAVPSPQLMVMPDPLTGSVICWSAAVVFQVVTNACAGGSPGAASRTVIVTVSVASTVPSFTVSVNVNAVSAVTSGAVKVAVGASLPVMSITGVAGEAWVHSVREGVALRVRGGARQRYRVTLVCGLEPSSPRLPSARIGWPVPAA